MTFLPPHAIEYNRDFATLQQAVSWKSRVKVIYILDVNRRERWQADISEEPARSLLEPCSGGSTRQRVSRHVDLRTCFIFANLGRDPESS